MGFLKVAAVVSAVGLVAPSAALSAASAAPAESKPVTFGKLVVKLPVGDPYLVFQSGGSCRAFKTATYPGGQTDLKVPDGTESFRDEFTKAGLTVDGDATTSLFEAATPSAADFVIAGTAVEFHEVICTPNLNGEAAVRQKGSIHMVVDWQLYSRLQKQVLATVRTTADYETAEVLSGGAQVMLSRAFAKSMGQLAASSEVRTVLQGKPRGKDELVLPTPQSPIRLEGAATAPARGVEAELESVVLVRAGGGYGSGFLVSRDGYILTAAHVVGDAKVVKIRWLDKKETDGAVVRISRQRDVALIKVEPRGRTPMLLRRDAATPGQGVFVVGAPWDQELQSTITRGVLSASRVNLGFTFLQSDVTVGPGASGGPLLDEQGRVLGITVLRGTLPFGAAMGVNFFVPINDALAFLSAEPR